MALSDASQAALGILQVVGLVIPVLFLTARQYMGDNRFGNGRNSEYEDSEEIEAIDSAPVDIQLAWIVIALLTVAGVLAAGRIAIEFRADLFLLASMLAMALALLILAYLFYRIRTSFRIYAM